MKSQWAQRKNTPLNSIKPQVILRAERNAERRVHCRRLFDVEARAKVPSKSRRDAREAASRSAESYTRGTRRRRNSTRRYLG